jgi:hypothetical protein
MAIGHQLVPRAASPVLAGRIRSGRVRPGQPGKPSAAGGSCLRAGDQPAERDRLRRQSEELRADSAALLDRVGVERGWDAIDLGCGQSGIIDLLAERVGPEGNVTIAEGDARRTGLPPSSFDPPHPAWDRLSEIFWKANQSDGADLLIGRRLPELFRQAGLVDIGVEVRADIYPAGHSRRTVRPDLVRSMRPKILAQGIASERELDELDQAVRAHLDDPATLVMPNLLFRAWARKPVA